MTNPPETAMAKPEETMEKVREWKKHWSNYELGQRQLYAEREMIRTFGDFADFCEQLLEENQKTQELVEALEKIASKECKHVYPDQTMTDSCEACLARETLQSYHSKQ